LIQNERLSLKLRDQLPCLVRLLHPFEQRGEGGRKTFQDLHREGARKVIVCRLWPGHIHAVTTPKNRSPRKKTKVAARLTTRLPTRRPWAP